MQSVKWRNKDSSNCVNIFMHFVWSVMRLCCSSDHKKTMQAKSKRKPDEVERRWGRGGRKKQAKHAKVYFSADGREEITDLTEKK